MNGTKLRVILFGEPGSTFTRLHYAVLSGDPNVDLLLCVTSPPPRRAPSAARAPFLSVRHRLRRLSTRLALEARTLRYIGRPAALVKIDAGIVHPSQLRKDEALGELMDELRPDLIISAGFRQILPPALLAIPRLGAYNCHPSPLPRYAGANPWFWILRAGEPMTAVTIHRMVEQVDAGDIVAQRPLKIGVSENHQSLYNRTSVASAILLRECFGRWLRGTVNTQPQDLRLRTAYATPREQDAQIQWSWTGRQIVNLLRAASPAPGALLATQRGRAIVHEATALPERTTAPGIVARIDGAGVVVSCADGSIRLTCISIGSQTGFGKHIATMLGVAAGDRLSSP